MSRKRKILLFAVTLILVLFGLSRLGRREFLEFHDPQGERKQTAVGKKFMVVAGTPFAAKAGEDALKSGGNAADAATAALLTLNVTFNEAASFPSVAPLLYYDAGTDSIESYIGAGRAPQKATIDFFKARGDSYIPRMSILAQLIPASPDVIVRLLKKHGSRSFCELSRPASALAHNGFPVLKTTAKNLDMNIFKRIGYTYLMPYNSQVYLEGRWWQGIEHLQKMRLTDLGNTIDELCHAEEAALARGKNRDAALDAVRDYFYRGPIAEKIIRFHEANGGLFSREDLSGYQGGIETPLSMNFREYTLFTNQTWDQGIVVLMALGILENLNLAGMRHNSPEYINVVTQAVELAMADREAFIGDPAFVQVPVAGLLSKAYGKKRAALISARAFGKMPPHGDPWEFQMSRPGLRRPSLSTIGSSPHALVEGSQRELLAWNGVVGKDTSYIGIIDAKGSAVSLTPSDFPMSPMVTGTGLTLGIRMTQFRLDPDLPASLAPGKRPRITPHALMARRNGKFYMTFGTPGGDMQTQALVQLFLNHAVFGMDIQKAVETPRFRSRNWPDSFSPHEYFPGQLDLEAELAPNEEEMKRMGYTVSVFPSMDNSFSSPGAIIRRDGMLHGGADPRESTTAAFE